MADTLRDAVLRAMRVPPSPQPPSGAAASVRVFRAARSYYTLRRIGWVFTQLATLAAILFWIGMLERFEGDVERARAGWSGPPPAGSGAAPRAADLGPGEEPGRGTPRKGDGRSARARLATRVPWWLIPLLKAVEIFGIVTFLAQLPLTFALLRLDYELRWYIVTDRSLRIRSGIIRIHETTMSFANVQQVMVSQGPLQRLLGISDLRVQSAGGGGEEARPGHEHGPHTGVFHGVDNASEIRDLILERLRKFRAAGLGDPDDYAGEASPAPWPPRMSAAVDRTVQAASRELLAEARALREAVR